MLERSRLRWRPVAALLVALSCGGATATNNQGGDAGGSNDAGVDSRADAAGPTCGQPPLPVQGTFPALGNDSYYAIEQFFLGDTRLDGSPDSNAWKTMGFDLDGVDTTDPQHHPNCMPRDWRQLLDGECGIDNGFATALQAITLSTSQLQTAQARSGKWTLLLSLYGHEPGASRTSGHGALYVGAPLSAPPRFDGSDVWPPTTDSAPGGSPLDEWTDGYVVNGKLFVTDHMAVAFDLAEALGRKRAPFQLRVIEVDLPTSPGAAVRGVMAGNILLNDFAALVPSCGGSFDPRQVADILATDAVDPQTPCDALSFGFAFLARPVTIGTPAPGLPEPTGCQ